MGIEKQQSSQFMASQGRQDFALPPWSKHVGLYALLRRALHGVNNAKKAEDRAAAPWHAI